MAESAYADRLIPIEFKGGSPNILFTARPPKPVGSGEPLPNLAAPNDEEGDSERLDAPLMYESRVVVRRERAGIG